MSDQNILGTIGQFIQNKRLSRNESQGAVAKAAGISRSTLSLLERGEKVTLGSLIKVLRVLDQLHVLSNFSIAEEISPMQQLRQQKKYRQRASKTTDQVNEDELGW